MILVACKLNLMMFNVENSNHKKEKTMKNHHVNRKSNPAFAALAFGALTTLLIGSAANGAGCVVRVPERHDI